MVRNSVGRRRIGKKEEQEGEKGVEEMKNPNSKMRRSESPKKSEEAKEPGRCRKGNRHIGHLLPESDK